MFIHNFLYSLKVLFKNKSLIFWTFAFPLILGTLFNLAFSNIESTETFNKLNIGVVYEEGIDKDEVFVNSLNYLGDSSNENQLFNIENVDLETAKKLLNDKEIVGYLYYGEEIEVYVSKNGVNESIFKNAIDEIKEISLIVNNNKDKDAYSLLNLYMQDININDSTNDKMSYTMIEYYTLIAMTCLYGGILSMYVLRKCLPNLSKVGKRVAISSISKFKLIISSLLASYLTQLIGLALLFLYTIFILHIDYGNNLLFVLILALLGSLSGLSLGVFSCNFKLSENGLIGLIIAITMLFSWLSGMMGITMKYVVDKNVPIINKLNPANMITDGFYSLYYYNTLDRYIYNVLSLLIFSVVLIAISYLVLRREKYDSI